MHIFCQTAFHPLRGHWLCKKVNLNWAIWSPTTRVWCWNLSTCGNHCLKKYVLCENNLPRAGYWIPVTISNKFIHHSSSETISFQIWMPVCQGSPRAKIWEAPKQSCPLPGIIFLWQWVAGQKRGTKNEKTNDAAGVCTAMTMGIHDAQQENIQVEAKSIQ